MLLKMLIRLCEAILYFLSTLLLDLELMSHRCFCLQSVRLALLHKLFSIIQIGIDLFRIIFNMWYHEILTNYGTDMLACT